MTETLNFEYVIGFVNGFFKLANTTMDVINGAAGSLNSPSNRTNIGNVWLLIGLGVGFSIVGVAWRTGYIKNPFKR